MATTPYHATLAQALRTRVPRTLHSGDQAWVSIVVGPRLGELPEHPAPQVFMVEQAPHAQVPPHFHNEDQFQLVIAGRGRIGKHAVRPYSAHYAQGHTGYGPVVADAEGLTYLSIRAQAEWLTHYLPQERARQQAGARLNLFAPAVAAATGDGLAALGAPRLTGLFGHPSGVAAWAVELPPHRAVPLHDADGRAPGACCLFVIAGTLRHAAEELGAPACRFVTAQEESHATLQAGDAGAQVLCMRFRPDAGRPAG